MQLRVDHEVRQRDVTRRQAAVTNYTVPKKFDPELKLVRCGWLSIISGRTAR